MYIFNAVTTVPAMGGMMKPVVPHTPLGVNGALIMKGANLPIVSQLLSRTSLN